MSYYFLSFRAKLTTLVDYVDSPDVADKDFNFHNTSKIVAKLLEPKEIFKKELECNKVKLYVKAEVDFDFDGQGTLTVSGSGQLTPKPSFSSFQGLISMSGAHASLRSEIQHQVCIRYQG